MSQFPDNASSAPARASFSSEPRHRIDSLDEQFLKQEERHNPSIFSGPSLFRPPHLTGSTGTEQTWTSRDSLRPVDAADIFSRPPYPALNTTRAHGGQHDLHDMSSRTSRSLVSPFSMQTSPDHRSSVSTFSLPPLTAWRNTEDTGNHGKHKACVGCERFGSLVHELADVTALLLSDLGHLTEEGDDTVHSSGQEWSDSELRSNFFKFNRSLRHLRTFRHSLRANLTRDAAPGLPPSLTSSEHRRYSGDYAESSNLGINALLADGERPRKRSRLSSPGLGRGAMEGAWRMAEATRGPETMYSPTSPPSRQPPSPISNMSYRQPLAAQHSGILDRTISNNNNGSSLQPSALAADDAYQATLPPISAASTKSYSHSQPSSTAESTHYADLQRQITLKTLSLQTLQSEYSSLLQKLHRERLRSQTIERKSAVAEGEVNALTTQNEDLLEQIRSLNTSIDACEAKIETMRADSNRDKDQWVNILSNNTKILARSTDDTARLEATVAKLQKALDAPLPEGPHEPTSDVARLHARVADLSGTSERLRAALSSRLQDSRTFKAQVKALMETLSSSDERHARALAELG